MRVRRAVVAGAVFFAVLFGAGFALGVVRTLVLVPRLGELGAVACELPLMLAWAYWTGGVVVRRARLVRVGERGLMGASAFALLLVAEAVLAALLRGGGPGALLAHWGTPAGAVGLAAQVLACAFPLAAASTDGGGEAGRSGGGG